MQILVCPPRVFVAEIGFLATCWVGFFAGWFIGRITVPAFDPGISSRYTIRGFLVMFACTFTASVAGSGLGLLHGTDYSGWAGLAFTLGIIDLPGFVCVAYIHNASYLGGLIGLIVALIYLRKIQLKRVV